MTPEEFAASFETVAEAPGAIKKLRDMILGFAVRGRLVSQDPTDEPASALMHKLVGARAKLSTVVGGARDPVAIVEASGEPYPLPPGWSWIRLGGLGGFLGGGTPSKSNAEFWSGKIPWVSPKDMKRPHIGDAEDHISEAAVHGSTVKMIPQGSLLFVIRGMILAHSFPTALTTREVTINQDMKALVLALPAMGEYLLRACQAARARMLTNVEHSSHGTCRLDSEHVQGFPIPVPPLAEQKRIVAKVDQLMALCDDLEARQAKKRETAVRLNRAALAALTTAEGPEEVAASFRRIAENFEVLIDRAEKVSELRELIRQLAVMGRLVRQDPKDEPAVTLLAAITATRGGYQPRQESLVHGEVVRLPDLPRGWSWALASDAASEGTVITYGIIKPVWVTTGVPTVRVKDIQDGNLVVGDIAQCAEERASRFLKTRLSPEDLVIAKDGATLGKTAFVPASLNGGNVTQHVLRFSIDSRLSREYVRLVVDSPHGQRWMIGETRGVALPGVNVEDFRRMPLPIPPVSEQMRIVAKVEQLMALCDTLEAALRRAETTAQKLAEAVVAEIVA